MPRSQAASELAAVRPESRTLIGCPSDWGPKSSHLGAPLALALAERSPNASGHSLAGCHWQRQSKVTPSRMPGPLSNLRDLTGRLTPQAVTARLPPFIGPASGYHWQMCARPRVLATPQSRNRPIVARGAATRTRMHPQVTVDAAKPQSSTVQSTGSPSTSARGLIQVSNHQTRRTTASGSVVTHVAQVAVAVVCLGLVHIWCGAEALPFLPVQVGTGLSAPSNSISADLDGDGMKDLVMGSASTGSRAVLWARQTSPRVFAAAVQIGSAPSGARFVTSGLIDGDSRQDLVIVGGREVEVWLFKGSDPTVHPVLTLDSYYLSDAYCAQVGDVGTCYL
jgi:hypothetical protein